MGRVRSVWKIFSRKVVDSVYQLFEQGARDGGGMHRGTVHY